MDMRTLGKPLRKTWSFLEAPRLEAAWEAERKENSGSLGSPRRVEEALATCQGTLMIYDA